jgi:hypothetical protein
MVIHSIIKNTLPKTSIISLLKAIYNTSCFTVKPGKQKVSQFASFFEERALKRCCGDGHHTPNAFRAMEALHYDILQWQHIEKKVPLIAGLLWALRDSNP